MRPDDRRYLETHEWAKLEGDTVLVGLTDFAVEELSNGNEGDLVYCDLPEVGRQLDAGETFGEIESVKAVSDLYSPVTGEVVETNEALVENLDSLNSDPFEEGWMLKVRVTDESQDLLEQPAYEEMLKHAAENEG